MDGMFKNPMFSQLFYLLYSELHDDSSEDVPFYIQRWAKADGDVISFPGTQEWNIRQMKKNWDDGCARRKDW